MKGVRRVLLFLWHRICGLFNHPPHRIVQLFPLKGYYLLCFSLYLNIAKENIWGDSTDSLYIPQSPTPHESFISDYLDPEITFVTAYFKLGRFQKGNTGDIHFDLNTYVTWMNEFANFNNNVIAFTDLPEIQQQLLALRSHLPKDRTQIHIVNQKDTWAFSLAPKIKEIFADEDYPKHHPNTVLEGYPCAMHVKYELIEKVIRQRMHRTKYLAWIDIGYFREKNQNIFHLKIPVDFQNDHIAFLQMGKFEPGHTASTIIRDNIFWVAGGMFVARPEYLIVFVEDYKRTVEDLLGRGLMSTDQQVIYIMYTKSEEARPRIPIQTYSASCKCDWFYLAKLCRLTWERFHKLKQSTFMEIYHRNML